MTAQEATQIKFVICIRNEGYPAALELRKVYQVLPDEDAAKHHYLRVIDESGEDYLYPDSYFIEVDLPPAVREALVHAA